MIIISPSVKDKLKNICGKVHPNKNKYRKNIFKKLEHLNGQNLFLPLKEVTKQ